MDKLTIELDDADMIMLEHAADKDVVFNFVARTLKGENFRVIIKRSSEGKPSPKCFDINSDLTEDDLPF